MLLLRPLRQLPFALLWAGLATAATGDQLFAVVLSWVAVGLFGTAAGYLAALQAAATLTTALLAGRWADRVEPRYLMIAADLARAAMLLIVALVWIAHGEPAAWSLIVCVLVLAAGQALFRPALQATVPVLAGDLSLLPAANALLDTTERIARLLGPGLVGMIGALMPLVHFVTVNVATFLASALAVFSITRLRPPAPLLPVVRTSLLANVLHGFVVVRRHKLLGFMLAVTGMVYGTWYCAYFLGLPLMLGRGGAGLASYGTVISCYGATNLLSTLVFGNRGMAQRPARNVVVGNCIGGTGIVLLGLAGLLAPPAWLLPALIGAAALGAIGGPLTDITIATLRQTALPRHDLPAAVRAFMVMNNGGALLALLAAPRVFDAIGVAPAVMLCGAITLCAAATGWWRFAR